MRINFRFVLTVLLLLGPAHAMAQQAPGAPAETTTESTPGSGDLVGVLLGGSVISQQADSFSQADPFFGFLVGYRSAGRPLGMRVNLRFQGIFDVQPQKAEAPVEDSGDDGPDPTTFTPFLASRKTFDVDMHLFFERQVSGNLFVGPYLAGGISTIIDPNELVNDQVTKAENSSPTDPQELDLTRALAENDVDRYFEAGAIGNFMLDKERLFMQAMLLYGRYEALAGFLPEVNTRNRFIAKLRIFPVGLNILRDKQTDLAPMFGVELNGGRGPDQLKFFTGVAVAIKRFN